ncbi:MAG: phosphonate C-P lyase system protein PhnH [Pseudomonadota bacterium]
MKTENIWQADSQQQMFRQLAEAFSRPSTVSDLTPLLNGATAQRAVLATLMDGETTLADPHGQIASEDWPLLQARRSVPNTARYIVAAGNCPPDFQPALGSLESPEFGATLLIKIDAVVSGSLTMELNGPGIKGRRELCLSGLHIDWLHRRADWVVDFPLGVDILLFDATCIVALPRTTHVAITGGDFLI